MSPLCDRRERAGTAALLRQCDAVSQLLKCLAHPDRLRILCHMAERERSVSELIDMCGISQSAISQFLNRMKAERIVDSRRGGHFVYYSVVDQRLVKLLNVIGAVFC